MTAMGESQVLILRAQLTMVALGHHGEVPFTQQLAEAVARKLARGRQEASNQEWDTWIEEALLKGVGKAHRWTNQPNTAVPQMQTTTTGAFLILQH